MRRPPLRDTQGRVLSRGRAMWNALLARMAESAGRGVTCEIAKRLGVTHQTISDIGAGKKRPSYELAAAIEDDPLLGIPVRAWADPPHGAIAADSCGREADGELTLEAPTSRERAAE